MTSFYKDNTSTARYSAKFMGESGFYDSVIISKDK